MSHCLTALFVPLLMLWSGASYHEVQGRPDAVRALHALVLQAEAEGIPITVVSGYRSFERQLELYDISDALGQRAVEPAGCSQHQLGTAFDLAWTGAALNPEDPRNQLLYAFLEDEAGDLGFSQPYSGVGNIIAEPWHVNYDPPCCVAWPEEC